MSKVLLSEFLHRVQDAGGNLEGCLLSRADMENPHVFNEIIISKSGKHQVKVRTGGSSNIAHMVPGLIVTSISGSSRRSVISDNRHVLLVSFDYP